MAARASYRPTRARGAATPRRRRSVGETVRALRLAYRNWLRVVAGLALLRRPPDRLRLRDGTALARPARTERVHALANAVAHGWIVTAPGSEQVVVSPAPGIFLRCRWTTGFDLENAIEVFIDQVYHADVDGKVVVDVGAGVGDAALYFAQHGARTVWAFEPHPESFALATEGVRGSPWTSVVHLWPEAVVGNRGDGVLRFPRHVPSAASLDPADDARARWVFDAQQRVVERPLDSILLDLAPERVGLLKVDCQGGEYALFEGLSAHGLSRIDAIVIEFTAGGNRLAHRLEASGFSVEFDGQQRGYLRAIRLPSAGS